MNFILAAILFWSSIFLTPLTFIIALVKPSWKWMLSCFVASLPFSLYLLTGEPPISYIACLPVVLLIQAVVLFYKAKAKHKQRGIDL